MTIKNIIRLILWICLLPIIVPFILFMLSILIITDSIATVFNFMVDNEEIPFKLTRELFKDLKNTKG